MEIERLPFYTGKPEDLYHELKQKATPDYQVIDPTGKAVASRIVKEDVRFGYDLPKDAFRQPYIKILNGRIICQRNGAILLG